VIGVGGMGSHHAWNAATRIPGAQVVALADLDLDRADQLAARLDNPRTYRAPEDLIADSDVDAVIVTSPPASHAELISACAEAGKHVFTEKPVAVDMEQANAAAAAARDAGIYVQVGFNRRFDAAYVAASEAIGRGEIGQPVVFRSITRDRVLPPESYLTAPGSPGMLVDTGVHDFDLARWLMGDEVVRVHTVAAGPLGLASGHTAASVNLQFHNGSIGNVETVWGVGYGDDVRTEIVGSEGAIAIGSASRLPVRRMTANGLVEDGYPDHFDRFGDSYLSELRAFVDAVETHGRIESTLEDGVLALRLALAARESAETGMPVDVPTAGGA
jgi:scyllo-inositol 2-dehydrogenase (NAD+)